MASFLDKNVAEQFKKGAKKVLPEQSVVDVKAAYYHYLCQKHL